MPDRLRDPFPDWTDAQRQAVVELIATSASAMVKNELRLERRRFYMTSVLLVVTGLLALAAYTTTQSKIVDATRQQECVVQRLIIRVTPLQPRGVDKDGKPLHYTNAQAKQVRDFRDLMLGALPPGLHCPPDPGAA